MRERRYLLSGCRRYSVTSWFTSSESIHSEWPFSIKSLFGWIKGLIFGLWEGWCLEIDSTAPQSVCSPYSYRFYAAPICWTNFLFGINSVWFTQFRWLTHLRWHLILKLLLFCCNLYQAQCFYYCLDTTIWPIATLKIRIANSQPNYLRLIRFPNLPRRVESIPKSNFAVERPWV